MRAAIYARISRDPEGKRNGVDRQEEDCRALAEREGLTLVEVWTDNDIGASTLSKKARPAYDAMLAAARNGEIDVIVGYSNSRLTRRPRELEDLIELHDRHGVRIKTVVSGSDDLSTADGRMTARIKASVDAAEAERTGERLRRAFLQKAQRGDPHNGSRAFGWQADKVSLDPAEAAMIRKAAEDVIDGVGLIAICREWNDAGVPTARGNAWDHRGLRQLLKGPRLVGWRRHQGEIVVDASGRPVQGSWEPILDRGTYERLQAALRGRQGAPGGRRGARKYLLSGVLSCGICGARMYGMRTQSGTRFNYTCRGSGHNVSVSGPRADETVSAVVAGMLDRTDFGEIESFEAAAPFTQQRRLDEIADKISELMDAYKAGHLSGGLTFAQVGELEAEKGELEAQRDRALDNAMTSRTAISVSADDFAGLDLARQRSVIEALLKSVVVAPSRRGVAWSPERLSFVWRSA